MRLQTTSIIRNRGQLTIPETIRKTVEWATPLSVVTVSVERANEITIKPHSLQKKIDWDMIWHGIRLARSFKGKKETKSANQMISEDRKNR